MHPAFSILFFTTLAGAAQGLVMLLALSALGRVPLAPNFVLMALQVAEILLVAGLAASFLHLGRNDRTIIILGDGFLGGKSLFARGLRVAHNVTQ